MDAKRRGINESMSGGREEESASLQKRMDQIFASKKALQNQTDAIRGVVHDYGQLAIPELVRLAQGLEQDDADEVFVLIKEAIDSGKLKPEDFEPHLSLLLNTLHEKFGGFTRPLVDIFDPIFENQRLAGKVKEIIKDAAEKTDEGEDFRVLDYLSLLPKAELHDFIRKNPLVISRLKRALKKNADDVGEYGWRAFVYFEALSVLDKEAQKDLLYSVVLSLYGHDIWSGESIERGTLSREESVKILRDAYAAKPMFRNEFLEVGPALIKDFDEEKDLPVSEYEEAEEYEEDEKEKAQEYLGAVRRFLISPDAKIKLFKETRALDKLPEPQAWISVHAPEHAQRAFSYVLGALKPKEKAALLNVLAKYVGTKKLTEVHYRYYPDEIIDALSEYIAQNPRVREDGQWKKISSDIGLDEEAEVQLRYIRRTASDLRLGDKCGDCTAHGAIHFQDSLSWYINPVYQILVMKEGGRFMGKIGLALVTVRGKPAIIIDVLEFHPQAASEEGPYYKRAKRAFERALEFAQAMAEKQKVKLYALTRSNSGEANNILDAKGRPLDKEVAVIERPVREGGTREIKSFSVGIKLPEETVKFIESGGGKIWYQLFEERIEKEEDMEFFGAAAPDLIDQRLNILERDVINPAQIRDRKISEAMSGRDFELAARLIMANKEWAEKVNQFFKITPEYGTISPELLARKIGLLYRSQGEEVRELGTAMLLNADSFVRLSRTERKNS